MSQLAQPDRDDLMRMFKIAATIRAVDEKITKLIMTGAAAIMFYPVRGHEIIAAALGACLRREDYLVTNYRGMHDVVAKGIPLPELIAEYLGRSTGTCKGKGGAMHITHPDTGVMVTTGVVGGGLPIANGLALSAQLDGSDRVTVCNFGDGASNIGAFHEALNLAAVWKLPVVFACQNNGIAEHTAYEDCIPVSDVATRAVSYGMKGMTVDGLNSREMFAAASEAIDHARSGAGPVLLEAKVIRVMGHFLGDDQSYREPAVVAAAAAADPVPALRATLLTDGVATEDDLATTEAEIRSAVDAAAKFALDSPPPELDELERDVFAQQVVTV